MEKLHFVVLLAVGLLVNLALADPLVSQQPFTCVSDEIPKTMAGVFRYSAVTHYSLASFIRLEKDDALRAGSLNNLEVLFDLSMTYAGFDINIQKEINDVMLQVPTLSASDVNALKTCADPARTAARNQINEIDKREDEIRAMSDNQCQIDENGMLHFPPNIVTELLQYYATNLDVLSAKVAGVKQATDTAISCIEQVKNNASLSN